MGMEPINTIASVQAQTMIKPVAPKVSSENTDVTTAETAVLPKMEQKTAVVAKSQEGSKNGSHEGQEKHGNEALKKAVEDINKNLTNKEAIFGIHDKTNRLTIKIVDKDTKEVIRELPPEKTLDMIAKAWELAGLLVDEKR